MTYSLIKKASARTIVGDVKRIAKDLESGAKKDLFTVYGVVTKLETGETDNGPWVAFRGRFEATNMIDGSIIRSSRLFLPDVAADLIIDAMEGGEVSQLELAFLVGIQESETSVTGYEYYAFPLMQPAEDDPLDRLKSSIKASLPAPPKQATETPPKEAVKPAAETKK